MTDTTSRRQTRSSQPAPPPPPEPVYCICREPDTPSRNMIACDSCGEWYHWDCVGLDEEIAQNIHIYICGSCQLATGRQTTHHPSLYTFVDPSLPSTPQAYPDTNYVNSTIDPSFIVDPYPLPDEFGGGSSSSAGELSRGQAEWYTDPTLNAGYASFYPAHASSSTQHTSQGGINISQQGFYPELHQARDYTFNQALGEEEGASSRQHQQQARLGKGTVGDAEWTEEETGKKKRKSSKAEQNSSDTSSKPRQQRKSSAKSISSNQAGHQSPLADEDPTSSQVGKPSGQQSPTVPGKPTSQTAKKPAAPTVPVKSAKEKEKEATEGLRKAGSTAIATVLKALLAEEKATVFAGELEELVWNAEDGGSVTGRRKYTDRMRSLRFNLSKEDRKALRSGIKEGAISPLDLSKMSSNDLANPALQLLTQDAADTALRTRVLPETASQPLVVQNHKGVMEVSDSRLELQRQEEREQMLQESERNKRKRESEADNHPPAPRKSESEGQQLPDSPAEEGDEKVEKEPEDTNIRSSAKKQRNSSSSSIQESEDATHKDVGSPSGSPKKSSSSSASSPTSSPVKGTSSGAVPPSPVKFSLDSIWGDKPPTTDRKTEGSHTPPPMEDDSEGTHKDAFMVDDTDWVGGENEGGLSPFRDAVPARTEGGSGDDDLVLDFFVDDQAREPEKTDAEAGKPESVEEAQTVSGPLEYEEKKSIEEVEIHLIEEAWEGQINNPDAPSSGTLVARQVGGPRVPLDVWPTLLPSSSVAFAGRVKTDSSRKYLMQTHLSPSKEIIVVSFEAREGDAEGKEAEKTLMDFLSERDRDALINPYESTSTLPPFAARDLYVLSLRQKDPMPEFLILLDSCKVPEVRTKDYLLGVFIRQKSSAAVRSSAKKVVSPPPSVLPPTTTSTEHNPAANIPNVPVGLSTTPVYDPSANTMQVPLPMPMPTLPPGATPFPIPMPMPTLPLPMPAPTLPIPPPPPPPAPPIAPSAPALTSDSIASLLASLQGVVKSPMPDSGTSTGPAISNQPASSTEPSSTFAPPNVSNHQSWMPPPGYYPPPPPPPSSSAAPIQHGTANPVYAPTGTPSTGYPIGGHTPSQTSSGGHTPSYASGPPPPTGSYDSDGRSPVYGNGRHTSSYTGGNGQPYPTGPRRGPQANGSPPRDKWDQPPARGYPANSWDRQPPPPPPNSGYEQSSRDYPSHDYRQRDRGAPSGPAGRERGGDGGWAARGRRGRGGGRY